ncbi:collagen alpha-1(XXV) chain-like [Bombina bombina]|uniref:collagen alpha-1(XXV) chain-like n=1 Tax=Bombina bombina TaxID=8345 RepID=UPI00235A5923|nr:collagen alpha-1(XXV) chain-like [Bombina bombina]
MLVKEKEVEQIAEGNYHRIDGTRPEANASCWAKNVLNMGTLVLSLMSLAWCLYINVKTSDLQGRVLSIEHGKSGEISLQVPGFSMDQLNSIVQEKVDRLLSQRSYEHMAKIRVSRDAPAECNCPAGPPGQRGKRGRRGEAGPPVSILHLFKLVKHIFLNLQTLYE